MKNCIAKRLGLAECSKLLGSFGIPGSHGASHICLCLQTKAEMKCAAPFVVVFFSAAFKQIDSFTLFFFFFPLMVSERCGKIDESCEMELQSPGWRASRGPLERHLSAEGGAVAPGRSLDRHGPFGFRLARVWGASRPEALVRQGLHLEKFHKKKTTGWRRRAKGRAPAAGWRVGAHVHMS